MKPQTFVLREDRHAGNCWNFLKGWKAAAASGKPWAVTIGPEKSKRSLQANAYYWGVVVKQISEQAWFNGKQYAPEVWHEEFREMFCPRIDRPMGGSYPAHTADMPVEDFQVFTQKVEEFAARVLFVQFVEGMAA